MPSIILQEAHTRSNIFFILEVRFFLPTILLDGLKLREPITVKKDFYLSNLKIKIPELETSIE